MGKIAAVATCTALAVALAACGGVSEKTTRALSSQRTEIAIKKTRDKLRAQARALRGTVSDLRSRVGGLHRHVRSESATLRTLEDKASGARYLVRHSSIPGTGTFLVNKEINPGTYRAASSPGCYWERESNLNGDVDSIAANDNADGPVIVAVSPADVAFKASGCATFHKVG
jgi:hypothetical protein